MRLLSGLLARRNHQPIYAGLRCRRASATALMPIAIPTTRMISPRNSDQPLTLEAEAGEPLIGSRGPPDGSSSKFLRELSPLPGDWRVVRPAGRESRRATFRGRVAARDGMPGAGWCPPVAKGMSSQYWFKALAALPLQLAPGAMPALLRARAPAGARISNTRRQIGPYRSVNTAFDDAC